MQISHNISSIQINIEQYNNIYIAVKVNNNQGCYNLTHNT